MEICDIMWLTMSDKIRLMVNKACEKYETDAKYQIKKFYEDRMLKGFCVCHDEGEFTVLDEAHYIGFNKYVALKMWKFMTTDKHKLRIICQKVNTKMAELYKRIGFKIVGEDFHNFTFERVK